MVIRNKCEGFYNHFSSVEDRIESNEIKQLVAEKQSESGLYELCKKEGIVINGKAESN